MSSKNQPRFWEIDGLRGLMIVLMVVYHLIFDLAFFGALNFNLDNIIWRWFAGFIAGSFLLLVGISLTLSAHRRQNQTFRHHLKRGAFIFGGGLLITLVTYILTPDLAIVFGILHLIGLAIVIAYPFLNFKFGNLIGGFVAIIAGIYLSQFNVDFPWLIWLGLTPADFASLDYYPLLPWVGIVLIGIALGNIFYPQGQRKLKIADRSGYEVVKNLSFFGRHSLLIYLLHQPILIAILMLTNLVKCDKVITK